MDARQRWVLALALCLLAGTVDAVSIAGGGHATTEGLERQEPLGLQSQAAAGAALAPAGEPRLFFLFMVYVSINNEEVWEKFFAGADNQNFHALVHCKSEASCRENIKAQHRFEIIPTVETQYCLDLVAGMNALLRAALSGAGASQLGGSNPHDKFIFVSDSTVPVKPYSMVRSQLTESTASDFCIFPRNEWAEITESFGDAAQPPLRRALTKVAVKHHQWVVLSRKHAQISVDHAHEMPDLMQKFQLNMGFRNTGCLDEFWHFALLFRTIELNGNPETVQFEDFGGGSISTGNYEIQGRCDTFVHWLPRASGRDNNMTQLAQGLASDPGTEMTPVTESRPASIRRLSKASLSRLRASPFLFARKVEDGCAFSGCSSLADAFENVVFSTTPRPQVEEPTFRGQGQWLDNRHSVVSISSLDGAVQLAGQEQAMEATGSYCGDEMEVVFSNGYRSSAVLAQSGQALRWDNGVVWERAGVGSAAFLAKTSERPAVSALRFGFS